MRWQGIRSWQEIKSEAREPRRRRRDAARPSSVYVAREGYNIAVVDARDHGKGWALWRRRGAGFERLVPALYLDTPEEAKLVAELEHRRRRLFPRLGVALVARVAALFQRPHARLVEAARVHHPEEAARAELLGRYLEALRGAAAHGQTRR